MNDALVGYSGFVGSTLLRQRSFSHRYRSTDIETIRGETFDTVVCAGAPAQKWMANKDPQADRAAIDGLIGHLKTVRCRSMILISTVDVFAEPILVDEATPVREAGLHAYGAHRRLLEQFVESSFENSLIVRLPGLVGPGLKKNVVFDFAHNNNLGVVDSRSVFQFYPMVNLWSDITAARTSGLPLIHLTSEPMSVEEVAREGFGLSFSQAQASLPVRYDMQTRYADLFGGTGRYQYSRREVAQALRNYAQWELL